MWDVTLPCANMRSFFTPVISDIKRMLDKQMKPKTKALIVPGGFGRSKYLMDILHSTYSHKLKIIEHQTSAVGAHQPVARGALLRYKEIEARAIPSKDSFGIAAVELWDPDVHPDATL